MKVTFLFICCLLLTCNSIAQTLFQLKIRKCEKCNLYTKEINEILKNEKSILSAYEKIKVYFNPNPNSGDGFLLKCLSCTSGYSLLKYPGKFLPKERNGFAGKGVSFNYLSELSSFFSDTFAILDSLTLDLARIIDVVQLKPYDIRVEYVFNSKVVRRQVNFDQSNQVLSFTRMGLFAGLPSSVIDTLSLSLFYYNTNGVKKPLSNKPFFIRLINENDQRHLVDFVKELKSEIPEFTEERIIDQIELIVSDNFGKTTHQSIKLWLSRIKNGL